jgi:hypothetical protein
MELRCKVSKQGERKFVELPKPVRDNFEVGEIVSLQKVKQPDGKA